MIKKRFALFSFLAVSVILILFLFNNQRAGQAQDTVRYELAGKSYTLRIADERTEWSEGLMFVTEADVTDFDGMIFIFPDSAPRSFWNKNTLLDLDIYWIQDGQIIGRDVLPSIKRSGEIVTVTSPQPADTVVEIIR